MCVQGVSDIIRKLSGVNIRSDFIAICPVVVEISSSGLECCTDCQANEMTSQLNLNRVLYPEEKERNV